MRFMVGVRDLVECMLGKVRVVRVKAVMMQKIMFRIRVKVRVA